MTTSGEKYLIASGHLSFWMHIMELSFQIMCQLCYLSYAFVPNGLLGYFFIIYMAMSKLL